MVATVYDLTTDQFRLACERSPELAADWAEWDRWPINLWRAVADDPSIGHEQASFVHSAARVAIARGGNRSGKSEAAAYKTARWVLDNPPPRDGTPFWVVGETLEMAGNICWRKYLSRMIPPEAIAGIDWFRVLRGWPHAVLLKTGWVLVFKSFSQGREALQGDAIGGAWVNEQPPVEIMHELAMRCVDYAAPIWADFTPLSPKHNADWQDIEGDLPPGWAVYRLNMLGNPYLPRGEAERVLAQVPSDLRGTRAAGDYLDLHGLVYKDFSPNRHVEEPFAVPDDWFRIRGVDFGYINPFVCLWIARDPEGRWHVYDEHYQSEKLMAHHAAEIIKRGHNKALLYADHQAQERQELKALLTAELVEPKHVIKDIWAGIVHLQSLLLPRADKRPGLLISKTCKNLIEEFRKYRYPEAVNSRNPHNVAEMPLDKWNHALDALRYALYSQHVADSGSAPVERLPPRPLPQWRKDFFGGVATGRAV